METAQQSFQSAAEIQMESSPCYEFAMVAGSDRLASHMYNAVFLVKQARMTGILELVSSLPL